MMVTSKIKEIIKEKNISIEALAVKIGYSRMGLTNALNSGDLKISVLHKIAEAIGVDITYFFCENNNNDLHKILYDFLLLGSDYEIDNKENKIIYRSEDIYNILESKINFIYQSILYDGELGDYLFKKFNITSLERINSKVIISKGDTYLTLYNPFSVAKIANELGKSLNESELLEIKKIIDNAESHFVEEVYNEKFIQWLVVNSFITAKQITQIATRTISTKKPTIDTIIE